MRKKEERRQSSMRDDVNRQHQEKCLHSRRATSGCHKYDRRGIGVEHRELYASHRRHDGLWWTRGRMPACATRRWTRGGEAGKKKSIARRATRYKACWISMSTHARFILPSFPIPCASPISFGWLLSPLRCIFLFLFWLEKYFLLWWFRWKLLYNF